MLRRSVVFAMVAALSLAACDGPGTDATLNGDAPGGDAAPEEPSEGDEEGSRPVVRGREDPTEREQVALEEAAAQACGRAVTDSGRYSQTGYDRGVSEGVDAGHDEDELIAAIEDLCGAEIAEARGD